MTVKDWEYYNHAAIPTTAPHKAPDLTPLKNKSIWKIDGGTPLLARWTTDFDCGYKTNWWYIIKDTPFDLEEISSSERKLIRTALKRSYVRRINMTENADALYCVYLSAYKNYKSAGTPMNAEAFNEYCIDCDKKLHCWGGFDKETNTLIGYMVAEDCGDFVKTLSAKFDRSYSRCRVSDAMYYTILTVYLNEEKKHYVSSGERTINHVTGTQEYKIKRFGYRKAYCNLHIEYNPKIKWLIKILYAFRKILIKFDKIRVVHLVNSIIKMQELTLERKE